MGKVTSKLQVTLPKAIADRFTIRPGDRLEWSASGSAIQVVPARAPGGDTVRARLAHFDRATLRIRARARSASRQARHTIRGWTRSDLYTLTRGRAR